MDIRGNGAQVVIVGAGPTGVMLAIELARRGVEVSILDKQPERSRESRAIAIHARTLELFHQLGIVDEFLDLGHRVDGFTFHTPRPGAISVDLGGLDSPYPFILMLSRSLTSVGMASASTPSAPILSAVLASAPASTSARTMLRPSPANRVASASPMPLAAPVTTATFPASSFIATLSR